LCPDDKDLNEMLICAGWSTIDTTWYILLQDKGEILYYAVFEDWLGALSRLEAFLGQALAVDEVACPMTGTPKGEYKEYFHLESPSGFTWCQMGYGPSQKVDVTCGQETRASAEKALKKLKKAGYENFVVAEGACRAGTAEDYSQKIQKKRQRFHDALAIVDPGACNPIGVAHSFIEGAEIVNLEGTDAVCNDPALRLMVDHLAHLMHVRGMSSKAYATCVAICKEKAGE
jgi:hypothetical protein